MQLVSWACTVNLRLPPNSIDAILIGSSSQHSIPVNAAMINVQKVSRTGGLPKTLKPDATFFHPVKPASETPLSYKETRATARG